MKKASILFAAVALGLFAGTCQSPLTPSLPLTDLLTAPLAVEINGRQFKLETFLWRDFMPPSAPEGSLLAANAYITAVDGQPFPIDIDATRIWVVNGEEVWEATFLGESRPRSPVHLNHLEKRAAGGPRWTIGAQVEVVVRVTALLATPRLLRATKQVIFRTD